MVNMVNLNKAELLAATERHVIGEGKLVGLSGAVTGFSSILVYRNPPITPQGGAGSPRAGPSPPRLDSARAR